MNEISYKQKEIDEFFMKQALAEAQKALAADEVPVGAVVVANNKIIARAHNLTQTLNDVTAHAEMQAITMAEAYIGGKYLHDCTLYVTLEPCMMCAGALAWAQLARVVYAAEDPKRGFLRAGIQVLHPKTQLLHGVLQAEAEQLLLTFFQKKRS